VPHYARRESNVHIRNPSSFGQRPPDLKVVAKVSPWCHVVGEMRDACSWIVTYGDDWDENGKGDREKREKSKERERERIGDDVRVGLSRW
jgi:hypothetical protein